MSMRDVFILEGIEPKQPSAKLLAKIKKDLARAYDAFEVVAHDLPDDKAQKNASLLKAIEDERWSEVPARFAYMQGGNIMYAADDFGLDVDPSSSKEDYNFVEFAGGVTPESTEFNDAMSVLMNDMRRLGRELYPTKPDVEPVNAPVPADAREKWITRTFRNLIRFYFPQGEFTLGQAVNVYELAWSMRRGKQLNKKWQRREFNLTTRTREALESMNAQFSHGKDTNRWQHGVERGSSSSGGWGRDYIRVKLP
jgi:hypothetical protein